MLTITVCNATQPVPACGARPFDPQMTEARRHLVPAMLLTGQPCRFRPAYSSGCIMHVTCAVYPHTHAVYNLCLRMLMSSGRCCVRTKQQNRRHGKRMLCWRGGAFTCSTLSRDNPASSISNCTCCNHNRSLHSCALKQQQHLMQSRNLNKACSQPVPCPAGGRQQSAPCPPGAGS